jgi:two-component sensor histidine kinase
MLQQRPAPWVAALVLFALAGVLESLHAFIGYSLSGRPEFGYTLRGQPMSFFGILARALPSWIMLGLCAGAALRITKSRPLFWADWKRSLLFHLPLAVVFSAVFLLTAAFLRHFLFVGPEVGLSFGTSLLRYYTVYFNTFFLFYWGIIGVYSAFLYYRDVRERELVAEKLRRGLADARLRVLQQQLQPHFLFNTLNAVSGLAVDGDTRGTIRTLALLGDLLRATLQRSEQVVSVAEELELLDLYLAIQRVRLEERLEVRTHIDPAVMSAEIPTFLLQPLVENAIRHGIAPSSQHGWIEIAASRQRDRVALTITDSGCGVGTEPIRLGVGLSNCIERLSQLYGSQYSFDLGDVATGGARVRVEWPWRQRPSGAPHRSESGMPDSMRDTEISDPAGSRRPARVP